MKTQIVTCLLLTASLSSLGGCGLAETGATAAAEAKLAADQAKQGKELEEKVKRDLDAAQKAEAYSRARAEEQSQ
ncbi:MAG TPA: hypothetical protein VMF52_18630 [Steroidobacteraceae bacterium]|nr:hypothetical protein [Steroidobacteraceae bacterium]